MFGSYLLFHYYFCTFYMISNHTCLVHTYYSYIFIYFTTFIHHTCLVHTYTFIWLLYDLWYSTLWFIHTIYITRMYSVTILHHTCFVHTYCRHSKTYLTTFTSHVFRSYLQSDKINFINFTYLRKLQVLHVLFIHIVLPSFHQYLQQLKFTIKLYLTSKLFQE